MEWRQQHTVWRDQVAKLKSSLAQLTSTDPKNLLQHFFLQATQQEFVRELDSFNSTVKTLICHAVELSSELKGTARTRAAQVLKSLNMCAGGLLQSIRLADIRNKVVFEVYKQCGLTVDTYFERYSSPPGQPEQNEAYLHIAHGNACASAMQTVELSNLVVFMQVLKRFFVVYDCVVHNKNTEPTNMNWVGAMWAHHIECVSLGDLIWQLFLDIWECELGSVC